MYETNLFAVSSTVKVNQSSHIQMSPSEKVELIQNCIEKDIEVVIVDKNVRIHHLAILKEFNDAEKIKIERVHNLQARKFYRNVYIEI